MKELLFLLWVLIFMTPILLFTRARFKFSLPRRNQEAGSRSPFMEYKALGDFKTIFLYLFLIASVLVFNGGEMSLPEINLGGINLPKITSTPPPTVVAPLPPTVSTPVSPPQSTTPIVTDIVPSRPSPTSSLAEEPNTVIETEDVSVIVVMPEGEPENATPEHPTPSLLLPETPDPVDTEAVSTEPTEEESKTDFNEYRSRIPEWAREQEINE